MPRTKLDRLLVPKRDPIKGLVLEYMSIQKISGAKVAENIGVGRATSDYKSVVRLTGMVI